ncbi:MAG: hypothetical protein EZS28_013447 [Streblomastix strix]|uniref:Uncharacterized protein n=1 Tax=Streblomastix strix TaxID=222440 RepID=A0A5J4W819_9EUKA|nr:MAG: hypothetical protein EZS28_013447 [Streblomastix strix]
MGKREAEDKAGIAEQRMKDSEEQLVQIESEMNEEELNKNQNRRKIKRIDTQFEQEIRVQLTIDLTADVDSQQRATGRNIKSNSGTGDKVMEPNLPRAQAEWRMEENSRLQNVEQRDYSQTLQDDRHMRYDPNAQERGLDVHA